MIQSGRTKSVRVRLEKWYNKEFANADAEWVWGFNKEALQHILDSRERIPIRCFLMRYLLEIHSEQIKPLFNISCEEHWIDKCLDEVLKLMENNIGKKYEDSPVILQKITDIVYLDFVSNQFFLNQYLEHENPSRIRGSVNDTVNKGEKKGEIITWDKNTLLKKISADKLSSDALFAFGFGLNMAFEDISFFLKKALRRVDFNLWNWQEFLLFITFKYAQGNIFEFYQALKLIYEDEKVTPVECNWIKEDNFSTIFIKDKVDLIIQKIKERDYTFALEEDGKLPSEIIQLLREYKYLINNSKNYARTISKESARLLEDFKKYIDGDDKAARKAMNGDLDFTKTYSRGNIIIHYDPEAGLNVPKGTLFYKIDKKTGRKIEFESEESIKIEPIRESYINVEIPVKCSRKTKKMSDSKKEYGYVPKTKFISNNPYLSEMYNKSGFKSPSKNIAIGDETHVSGTIFAKCVAKKRINAGTEFYPVNDNYNHLVFISEQDIDAYVFEKIWVHCLVEGEEATKNEIIGCNLPGWKENFEKLENTKIGFTKKKVSETNKGGVLFNYLYQPYNEVLDNSEIMDISYILKLGKVLEGTQLSSTKISQISSLKSKEISRNDILTLSFLAYMSEIEYKRIEQNLHDTEDYKARYAEFVRRTNEILKRCGYYELYAPNPYDSLLICLISSNEAINAYRNLWSWYLTNK